MKLCTAGASFLPNVPFVEHLNSQRMTYFHRILCFYYDSFLSLFIFFSCFFFSSLQSNLYAHFINAKFLFENFMACDKYSLFVNRSLAPSSSSSRYIIVYCHCNGEIAKVNCIQAPLLPHFANDLLVLKEGKSICALCIVATSGVNTFHVARH